jgi:hypothetical protein
MVLWLSLNKHLNNQKLKVLLKIFLGNKTLKYEFINDLLPSGINRRLPMSITSIKIQNSIIP